MDVEEEAYTMPRTMPIIQALLPECMASEDIKLATTRPFEVLHQCKLDVALQDERIVSPELFRWSAERYRTRDIRSPIEILAATIKKEHPLWTYCSSRVFLRAVVDDSPVAEVATDRAEAVTVELIILSTELIEADTQLILRVSFTTSQSFLQPLEEAGQRSAIACHDLTEASDLSPVLDSLELSQS